MHFHNFICWNSWLWPVWIRHCLCAKCCKRSFDFGVVLHTEKNNYQGGILRCFVLNLCASIQPGWHLHLWFGKSCRPHPTGGLTLADLHQWAGVRHPSLQAVVPPAVCTLAMFSECLLFFSWLPRRHSSQMLVFIPRPWMPSKLSLSPGEKHQTQKSSW